MIRRESLVESYLYQRNLELLICLEKHGGPILDPDLKDKAYWAAVYTYKVLLNGLTKDDCLKIGTDLISLSDDYSRFIGESPLLEERVVRAGKEEYLFLLEVLAREGPIDARIRQACPTEQVYLKKVRKREDCLKSAYFHLRTFAGDSVRINKVAREESLYQTLKRVYCGGRSY